jgi:hypothetical protein
MNSLIRTLTLFIKFIKKTNTAPVNLINNMNPAPITLLIWYIKRTLWVIQCLTGRVYVLTYWGAL